MTTTPNTTRKLAAGIAAVVLTLSAAGAAVAVNLTDSGVDSPAGKLAATEPVSTPESAVTPSTIYMDVTVPVPQDPSGSAATEQPAPAPAAPATSASAEDDHADDDSKFDDQGDDHQESDDHDGDHEDGADDDD